MGNIESVQTMHCQMQTRVPGRFLISVKGKLRGDTDRRLGEEIRELSRIRSNSNLIQSKH